MATFNKPIATNQGIALLKAEVSGSDSITFTKTVFSSDDYSQTADSDIANLTAIKSLDLTTNAQTFQDVNGNTKVRAIGYNNSVNQAFYIKTYALYAKNKSGNEILFAVASSQTADFVPAFNNAQLTQISYTFTFAIDQTSNITLSDQHEITVTQADLAGINSAVNSNASSLTAQQTSYAGSVSSTISSNANSLQAYISSAASSMQTALTTNSSNNSSYVSSATNSLTSYVASQVASMQSAVSSNATNITANSNAISSNATNISNLQSSVANNSSAISSNANSASSAVSSLQTSINSNSSAISSNAVNIANNSNAISSNASLTSQAVTQINNNISNIQNNMNDLNNRSIKKQDENIGGTGDFLDISKNISDGYHYITNFTGSGLPDGFGNWGFMQKLQFGNDFTITAISTNDGSVWSNTLSGYYNEYRGWKKLGG